MATLRVAVKPEAAPMKAAQISKPGADFELIERKIPEPGAGQVRIKVQACGVCHSDVLTSMKWGPAFPRGRRGSESASAGTAAVTAPVASASGEIFAIART